MSDTQPRIYDDDIDTVIVTFRDVELRSWSYFNDREHHLKMLCARNYVEGWCDGRDALTINEVIIP